MKRVFAILLAGFMVFSLVGCGDNAQEPATNPTSAPDSTTQSLPTTSATAAPDSTTQPSPTASATATPAPEDAAIPSDPLAPFVGEWIGKNGNDLDNEMSEDLAAYYSLTVYPNGEVKVDIDGVVLDTVGSVKDHTLTFTEPTLDISSTAILEDGVLHVENLLDLGINIDMEMKK